MPLDKYEDNYEGFFDFQSDFTKALSERCAETKRYELKPEEMEFWGGKVVGDVLEISRLDNEAIITKQIPIPPEHDKLWRCNETQEIGMFVEFPDNTGNRIVAPLSRMSKLSLGNRAKLTFNGDFAMPISKIALAKVYEDMIRRETKKQTVQIISVYGKVQAVMTAVYSPIGHDEFFEKVNEGLRARFGNVVSMQRGYISQKWSRATWDIGEYQDGNTPKKIRLGVSAMDSQTGHSSAILQPVIYSGRKMEGIHFDDTWHSKHMALTDDGINKAIDSVYLELSDNAQKLMDTINITLKFPGDYAQNLCNELNKLGKNTVGVLLPAKTIQSFVATVEGLGYIRSSVTVWDVIEQLWDIPFTTSTSENHKDGLMKTVSRVLALDHDALDKK